jgi:membrane protein YdbS with pleckstrin-like domain
MDKNTIGWILAFAAVVGAVLSLRSTYYWLIGFGALFLVGLVLILMTSQDTLQRKKRSRK